ncbi:hypothetical protein BSU04_25800 [Caballeronia sordidicola]|uniref:Uncharacterized protein n=1 Tax=Caballeronia sordidicola TaxID=196367 RepID=A0A226WXY8_CABSO|nr:hypothetical protein BSU04_25800 [Caballeronia sordidicola]
MTKPVTTTTERTRNKKAGKLSSPAFRINALRKAYVSIT